MAAILALDVGQRKIGVAVGDTVSRFAFPRPAILVDDWAAAWNPIDALIQENKVERIIVGWPLDASGQPSGQAGSVEDFISALQQQVKVPIDRRDERHTTQAVLKEQRGRHLARGAEDSLAAQLLLESYLMESGV